MSAGLVVESASTYRPGALSMLGLHPEDEFPVARSPAGFAYSAWLPEDDFLRRVYEEVIDHSRSVTGTAWWRQFLLELSARLLEAAPARPVLRTLDYGCGYGGLLEILSCRDIDCIGYEPSAGRRSAAREITVLDNLDTVAERGPFDLLLCTEVLEHMADPAAALRFLKANATDASLLLVTVPACTERYVDAALAGFAAGSAQSPVFNPWEHLNYFRPQDLRNLLAREGFAVVADLGRLAPARAAFTGKPGLAAAARAAKRLLASQPSTQLMCRPAS